MGINFPSTPAVNDIWPVPAVPGVPQYKWNGTAWVTAVAGDLPPVASVIVSDTPPPAPVDGAFWWESDTGILQIRYNDGVGPAQWVQAAGQATIDTSAFPPFEPAMAYSGLQINGGMEVSQERGTASVSVTSANKYVVDGWVASVTGGTAAATCSMQSIVDGNLYGLANVLITQCTTVNTLSGAGDWQLLFQPVEGYRWSRLGYPLYPRPCIISFFIYSSVAATIAVAVRNADATRSYVVDVPVVGGSWQFKSVYIPGCPSGVWNSTNGIGAYVSLCFGSGSGGKAAPNSWLTTNSIATASTTNLFNAVNNVVYVTGFTIIPAGLRAPTAEQTQLILRPYDQELLTCQRYYESTYPLGTPPGTAYADGVQGGIVFSGPPAGQGYGNATWTYRVRKRIAPPTAPYDMAGTPGKFSYIVTTTAWVHGGTFANNNSSDTRLVLMCASVGTSYSFHAVADARL